MGPRWRPVFIFLSLVNACLSELFVFNPVTFEPPNVLRPPVAELEYTPTQAVPVNDVNELGVSPQEAAEAFTGSQHALTSVVLANATEGLPKGLSKIKEERINSKSDFMGDDTKEASEILSEIGPAGSGSEEGNPEAVTFKREAMKTMLNMSNDAVARKRKTSKVDLKSQKASSLAALNKYLNDVAYPAKARPQTGSEACLRDYSVPCPQGFLLVANQCWPSAGYAGKCNSVQKGLLEAEEEVKMAWERQCDAYWPCLPLHCAVGENWLKNCPVSWYDNGDGKCVSKSLTSTNATCPTEFSYSKLTVADKRALARQCDLRWPCRPTECQRDYTAQCPEGWKALSATVCSAASDYLGPCPRHAQLGRFTPQLKVNFEIVCFTSWPGQVDCVRDYSTACPLGWTKLENGICSAPAEYFGPLPTHYDFQTLPVSQREASAVHFNIGYPCKGKRMWLPQHGQTLPRHGNCQTFVYVDRTHCTRDYLVSCPVGWTISSDGMGCFAPPTLATPCRGYTPFNKPEMSQAAKADLARECGAEYPCTGEYRYQSPPPNTS